MTASATNASIRTPPTSTRMSEIRQKPSQHGLAQKVACGVTAHLNVRTPDINLRCAIKVAQVWSPALMNAEMATQLFIQAIQSEPTAGAANDWRGPSTARVRSFIRRVEQRDFVGAIVHFYHEDAEMQENLGPIRKGREALLANEMDILIRYGKIPGCRAESFAINGRKVFINWVIDVDVPGVGRRTLNEVAMQDWEADRIIRERFYYDPSLLHAEPWVPTI